MKVYELIKLLEDVDPLKEVRIAAQPSYPLAHELAGIAANVGDTSEEAEIVWLVTGEHPADSPYAPSAAWDEMYEPY